MTLPIVRLSDFDYECGQGFVSTRSDDNLETLEYIHCNTPQRSDSYTWKFLFSYRGLIHRRSGPALCLINTVRNTKTYAYYTYGELCKWGRTK